MNRRRALAVISSAASASARPRSVQRKDFVGVWRLVSCESKETLTGTVRYPYGNNPVGRLTYDHSGRMSAQIMKRDRRTSVAATAAASAIAASSAEEMREVLAGYIAYFGTFDVDESGQTVIHHVDASLVPGWVGSDQRRTFSFSGHNRLTLTAVRQDAVNTLMWERESA